jgi:hypothetical protein
MIFLWWLTVVSVFMPGGRESISALTGAWDARTQAQLDAL